MSLLSRLANVFRPSGVDRALDEEIAFHIESRVEELIEHGVPRAAAEAMARRQFGNRLRVREASRDVKVLLWLDELMRDLRHGLRALRRAPTVTAIAIATLAIGIGANTAVFSVVNAVLLRPLPFKDGRRLVSVWSTDPRNPAATWVSFPDFIEIRAQSRTPAHQAGGYG
jgi:hypothetical protein